jgi:hypothetical protein
MTRAFLPATSLRSSCGTLMETSAKSRKLAFRHPDLVEALQDTLRRLSRFLKAFLNLHLRGKIVSSPSSHVISNYPKSHASGYQKGYQF